MAKNSRPQVPLCPLLTQAVSCAWLWQLQMFQLYSSLSSKSFEIFLLLWGQQAHMAVEKHPFDGHFDHMKFLRKACPCCKNILIIPPSLFYYFFCLIDTVKRLLWWAGKMLLCWGGQAGDVVWHVEGETAHLVSPTWLCAWGSMKLPKPTHLGAGATLGGQDNFLLDFWLQHPKDQC